MLADAAQENTEKRTISRSAFFVMLGGVFSLMVGFINQMIIAAFFGAGTDMDAYMTALVIPAYLQAVLLTGLYYVFIPAFVSEETKGNRDAAWELVGTFFWITTGVLVAVAAAGVLYSREIIALTAPGFGAAKSELAARMLMILMVCVPFAGLSTLTVGIQNARNSFFWPSFGGAINSLGNVAVVLLLTRWIGPMALPWGFLVATVLQACVTVVPVVRHGWPRLIALTDPRIRELAKLTIPFIVFGLLTRGTTVFERYFASGLPTGQISYLGYAAKISNIYQTLLVAGIGSAIFPALARAYAHQGNEGLRDNISYGLRLTLAAALPAVLISGALSIPLVRLLFQRGEFHPADTLAVAQVVLATLMGDVLCVMLGNILSRSFYVLKDTLTSPLVSTVSVVFYLAIGKYFAAHWGYIGLTNASLLQRGLFVTILYVILLIRLPGIVTAKTLESIVAYSLGAAWAFLVGVLLSTRLEILPVVLQLCVGVLASGSFYLLVLVICDREMLLALLEMFGVSRAWRLVHGVLSRVTGRKLQPVKEELGSVGAARPEKGS